MDDPVYAGYRHYVEKLKGLFKSHKKKDFFRGRDLRTLPFWCRNHHPVSSSAPPSSSKRAIGYLHRLDHRSAFLYFLQKPYHRLSLGIFAKAWDAPGELFPVPFVW
ncbi:hypothetical protein [Rhodothermus marinus]|uniref:hypothetical protein n=1 Tax=Rhodothermus marinus TaxID=29549 RepID=UPI001FB2AB8C|nr:hypothetical protein [Rhodothermus marinus]